MHWKIIYFTVLVFYPFNLLNAQDYSSDQHLELGYAHFKEAKFDSAILNLTIAKNNLKATNQYEDYAYSLLYLGKSYSLLANYVEAQKFLDQSLTVSEKYLGIHEATAKIYNAINNNYGAQAKFDKALKYSLKALEVSVSLYGNKHTSVIPALNSIAFNIRSMGKYDSALYWYNQALSMEKEVYDNYELEGNTTRTISGLGWIYAAKGEFTKSMEYLQQALKISEAVYGEEHTTTASKLKMIAWCATQLGDYDMALEYSKKTVEIRMKKLGRDHPFMATAYHDLGRIYMFLGEYDKAIEYQLRGNTIWENKFGIYDHQMANFHNNLGMSYSRKGDYEKALEQYEMAVEIGRKELGEDHLELANTYQLIADIYGKQKKFDAQYDLLTKALNISVNFTGPGHQNAGMIHRKLGKYYASQMDFENDLSHFLTAQSIFKNKYEEKHPMIAQTWADIGDHYLNIAEPLKALQYYQKSLITLSNQFAYSSIYSNPNVEDLHWKITALDVLDKKANAFTFNKTLNSLKESLNTYQVAVDLIESIKKEYVSETSKADLFKNSRKIYQGAIGISNQVYNQTHDQKYLLKAFHYSESAKSMLLYEVINTTKARMFAGVQPDILAKEKQLKFEIWQYSDRLLKARQERDSMHISLYQESLFNVQNEYENLIKDIEMSNPKYYNLKYADATTHLSEIQNQLLDDQSALIEYFIGEDSIYIFTCTKNNIEVKVVDRPANYNQWIVDYRKSITNHDFLISSPKKADLLYVESATKLYDLLLKQPLINLSNDITNLIIIPDDKLWHVNFQTLLTSVPDQNIKLDYSQLPYLLDKYSISFAYSAKILSFSNTFEPKSAMQFAGFAPSYSTSNYNKDSIKYSLTALLVRNGELPLPGALDEVQHITEVMDGVSFLGNKATENNFKLLAPSFDIIHLAMHSLLNDEHPSYSELIFNRPDTLDDGYLSVSEIYNLSLKAKLVVLSACNSGFGKLQNGEGPISISRAFSYAGCPSIIMSMWKIPDNATKSIMVEFYKNLKEGLPKDKSLQLAQLHYLNKTDDPLLQHPFYWASFLAMGDTQPLLSTSTDWSRIIFYIGLLTLVAVMFLRNKIQNVTHQST
ncbi:MAG TPA: CHAT domain-containing protein [Fulvivirga sp.]|nr:CHAT domain-containing protein [Fulvivirga sp.]